MYTTNAESYGKSYEAYRMEISIAEHKILLNNQLGVICVDMVDFRRHGHIYYLLISWEVAV